jgi:hypothetical protein
MELDALGDLKIPQNLAHQVHLVSFDRCLPYAFRTLDEYSNRFESAKNVGAQTPTNIPKRSAWAFDSAASPPVRNQIAMEPKMEANPRTKQSFDKLL